MIIGKVDPIPGKRYVPELKREIDITYNYIKHASPHPFRRWTISNFNQNLLKQIQTIFYSDILDVGCGEGFTLNFLDKKLDKKFEGIDFSPVAINLGKALFPKLNLKVADIYHLPDNDHSHDLVICTEVLEHLEYPTEALREIVRVSKKYVVLSVPNEPFFCLKNLVIGRNVKRLGNTKGHINLWTSFSFQRFVKEQDLRILSVRHPFPFTLVVAQKK